MIKLYYTIHDLLNIFLRADYFSKSKIGVLGKGRTLRILGNGKSLNDLTLDDNSNVDYMVVNRHVLADNYAKLRPRYYILADPYFFNSEEGKFIMQKIILDTKWEMNLFMPYYRRIHKKYKTVFKGCSAVLKTYNASNFKGYKAVAYFLYKNQLAMPLVQNVLVAAIMLGLQMEYDVIELYGVEHSWTKYLFVGNDNIVYLDNPHFFDKEKSVPKPFKEIQHTDDFPMWLALDCYMKMFKSYTIIRDYAKSEKLKTVIINKTPGSFIDAFKRDKD